MLPRAMGTTEATLRQSGYLYYGGPEETEESIEGETMGKVSSKLPKCSSVLP